MDYKKVKINIIDLSSKSLDITFNNNNNNNNIPIIETNKRGIPISSNVYFSGNIIVADTINMDIYCNSMVLGNLNIYETFNSNNFLSVQTNLNQF